ncbi:MAG TPA: hypothetical protein GX532_00445 [Clostridia bacterium]|jgi:hypothetical protein|nr:hypothetical protein [Clostridia bacterium]
MRITTQEIREKVIALFADIYHPFKEFQQNIIYKKYWDKCIEAISHRELLSHMIFCNDLFEIPPIKTFLMYYQADFVKITGDEKAELTSFIKKSMGAFWGMVFKFVLQYQGQKNVSVSMNKVFMLKTASYFSEPKERIILEE